MTVYLLNEAHVKNIVDDYLRKVSDMEERFVESFRANVIVHHSNFFWNIPNFNGVEFTNFSYLEFRKFKNLK